MLVDTHCHIHEPEYLYGSAETLSRANEQGVDIIICIGTNVLSSSQAINFAQSNTGVYASIGVHPHDTKDGWEKIEDLLANGIRNSKDGNSSNPKSRIVAIGEIGLDYYYDHSPRDEQIKALRWQIELALDHGLPIIFHVRDAFDDFWPIFDSYEGIRGELHSFTDNAQNLDMALRRGLYIGVNGISTFTKDQVQQEVFASIPLDKLLLETDAPFLTPAPFRGKVNEPAFVRNIAEHHAAIREISLKEVASATTANARALFAL